tara:strand:+ start:360 stop:650 length:291 start_codon:yes stop_codon:yes gene_type:complete
MTRIIWIALGILLVADCTVFGYFFSQTYSEYERFRSREQTQDSDLKRAEQELAAKQLYHRRLYNDPHFLERVVRERLNYSRANERIFIFPEEPGEL